MREPHTATIAALYRQFECGASTRHAKLLIRTIRAGSPGIIETIRAHVLGDAWLDFAVTTTQRHFATRAGFVYIAETPQYAEVFKVGMTAHNPLERVAQLNNESVLLPFRMTKVFPVHDRHYVEHLTHARLDAMGISRVKEFVRASPELISAQIEQASCEDLVRFNWLGLSGSPHTY